WNQGIARGLIRSKKRPFPNNVNIDLILNEKSVAIKISKNKISICGAQTDEQGLEAADLIINHIKRIQDVINDIQEDQLKARRTINYVLRMANVKTKQLKEPSEDLDLNMPLFDICANQLWEYHSYESMALAFNSFVDLTW